MCIWPWWRATARAWRDSAGQPANQPEPGRTRSEVSADGTIMVVWESDQQDGDGSGVYGRIYNSAGVSQEGNCP